MRSKPLWLKVTINQMRNRNAPTSVEQLIWELEQLVQPEAVVEVGTMNNPFESKGAESHATKSRPFARLSWNHYLEQKSSSPGLWRLGLRWFIFSLLVDTKSKYFSSNWGRYNRWFYQRHQKPFQPASVCVKGKKASAPVSRVGIVSRGRCADLIKAQNWME